MTRQNYYHGRRRRQRSLINDGLVLELVREERRLQPRLGTRKLHHLLKEPLAEAGVKVGRDRLFELLAKDDLLVKRKRLQNPRTTSSGH